MKKIFFTLMVLFLLIVFSCSKKGGGVEDVEEMPLKEIPLKSIIVTPSSFSLKIGETRKIEYTISPDNATDTQIEWTSSDENIATVNNLEVTGKKAGSCKVVGVSKKWGVSATIDVVISDIDISKITFLNPPTEIIIGQTLSLTWQVEPANATLKTVLLESSNPDIIEVSQDMIIAKAVGSATIIAKSENGQVKESIIITVKPVLVSSINLSLASVPIELGASSQISVTIFPDNATNKNLIWSSSNTNVLSVSEDGIITATGLGSATITAKSQDQNAIGTIEVTVVDFDYFINANITATITSYNSLTGLFTGAMTSTLFNNSLKNINVLSYEIRDGATNIILYKDINLRVLNSKQQLSPSLMNLSDVYLPYVLWTFSYNDVIYTREARIFY